MLGRSGILVVLVVLSSLEQNDAYDVFFFSKPPDSLLSSCKNYMEFRQSSNSSVKSSRAKREANQTVLANSDDVVSNSTVKATAVDEFDTESSNETTVFDSDSSDTSSPTKEEIVTTLAFNAANTGRNASESMPLDVSTDRGGVTIALNVESSPNSPTSFLTTTSPSVQSSTPSNSLVYSSTPFPKLSSFSSPATESAMSSNGSNVDLDRSSSITQHVTTSAGDGIESVTTIESSNSSIKESSIGDPANELNLSAARSPNFSEPASVSSVPPSLPNNSSINLSSVASDVSSAQNDGSTTTAVAPQMPVEVDESLSDRSTTESVDESKNGTDPFSWSNSVYMCTVKTIAPIENNKCNVFKLWNQFCASNCEESCSQSDSHVCLPITVEGESNSEWRCVSETDFGDFINNSSYACLTDKDANLCKSPPLPDLKLTVQNTTGESILVNRSIHETEGIFWTASKTEYCIVSASDTQPKLSESDADYLSGNEAQLCNADGAFEGLKPAFCYDFTLKVDFNMTHSFGTRIEGSRTSGTFCTQPVAPDFVSEPDVEAGSMSLTIHKPSERKGRIMCYYVILFKMAPNENIDDIRTEFLTQILHSYYLTDSSKTMDKMKPYVALAMPGFEEDSKTVMLNTKETDTFAQSSCGVCQNVTNIQLLPGNYLITVETAVESPALNLSQCGHQEIFFRNSQYASLNYSVPENEKSTLWIPILILLVILVLSLLVLSLLFITRNRRCEGMPIFSKLRFGDDINDPAFIENGAYSNYPAGGVHGSRSNQNMALVPINSNGFHMVNPHHPQVPAQMNNYAQVDPQKRMQADNDFKVALIEEYGAEYLEDRRRCKIEMTRDNAKEFVERKCTTPHFYYTFYKSRGLPPPGQPLEPEPKYHEMTQWDFEFERIAHDGYMEGECAPPQVLNDPSVIKINKFSDVCPYEFNRVKLSHGIKDNPNYDKTNGSLIEFPGLSSTRFIAIQGPDQPYYINQFWQIVYEYNCDVIAMLAAFNVSSGKDGVQYWPDFDDHEGATQVYGNYTVTMTDKRSIYSYMDHRVFQVTFTPSNNNREKADAEEALNTEDEELQQLNNPGKASRGSQSDSSSCSGGNGSESGETKIVHHFHFTMWNDYGIPTDTSSFWSFMDTAMAYHDSVQSPVLVHCRAGIGRTGTFIASHYLREMLERDQKVDVHSFVWQMRAKRKKFVQKVCQYRFIHQALLEHILFCDSRVQQALLQSQSFFSKPAQFRATILTQLQNVEFVEKYRDHHLEKEKGDYSGREETFPRDFQKIPYKYNFVRFPADIIHEVYSSYLNASWICGYNDELRKFIVTDLPYEVKHKTFWWMVLQHRISYIVYIGDLPSDGMKKEKPYWPDTEGQSIKFGRVNVKLISKRGFMPNEHTDEESQDLLDVDAGVNSDSSSPNSKTTTPPKSNKNRGGRQPPTVIIRQLVLTVSDDDENLSRGEEWRLVHVQYLLLDGASGPPSSPAHFAHFVSLIRNNLIGGLNAAHSNFAHRGVCNCALKQRNSHTHHPQHSRDSSVVNGGRLISSATDIYRSCDCAKPLLVQCLTGGMRSALFCAIWILSQDLEQTKSCNVPFVVHRLLEQRCTMFPCRSSDIENFKFVYECLRMLLSGTLDDCAYYKSLPALAHPNQSDSSGFFNSPSVQSGATNGSPPNGSLRPHPVNSPQAQKESLSFSNNLESPNNSSKSAQPDASFSTFKRKKQSVDYANVDLQLDASVV